MLLGVSGSVIWLISLESSKASSSFLVLFAIAASFPAERISPYEPAWNRSRLRPLSRA